MFLHFKNANAIHYKKSLYAIVVKKMYTKMSSVHGSSVLTVKAEGNLAFSQTGSQFFYACPVDLATERARGEPSMHITVRAVCMYVCGDFCLLFYFCVM